MMISRRKATALLAGVAGTLVAGRANAADKEIAIGGSVPLTTMPITLLAGTLMPLAVHVCGTVVDVAAFVTVHEPSVEAAVPF